MPIVPVSQTSVPPLIESLAQDLSACKILNWQYSGDNQNTSEWVDDMCESTYATLRKIAKDQIKILDENNETIEPFIGMSTNLEDVNLAINLDDPLSWKVPGTLLDSISSEREYNG